MFAGSVRSLGRDTCATEGTPTACTPPGGGQQDPLRQNHLNVWYDRLKERSDLGGTSGVMTSPLLNGKRLCRWWHLGRSRLGGAAWGYVYMSVTSTRVLDLTAAGERRLACVVDSPQGLVLSDAGPFDEPRDSHRAVVVRSGRGVGRGGCVWLRRQLATYRSRGRVGR